MNIFNYKTFAVVYRQYLKDSYLFAVLTKDKTIIFQDYVVCTNGKPEEIILSRVESILAKQRIGIFRIEILFAENTWEPYVAIWLPNDEIIADELKTKEKNIVKIHENIKNMLLNDIQTYKGYSILDYRKYGNNLQQKNVVAFAKNRIGGYNVLYDAELDEITGRIDRLMSKAGR